MPVRYFEVKGRKGVLRGVSHLPQGSGADHDFLQPRPRKLLLDTVTRRLMGWHK
ncbi:MAG TPA: hypothetical protein VJI67_02450 [archaeon]|nr:hypothetical protein [archaeon]